MKKYFIFGIITVVLCSHASPPIITHLDTNKDQEKKEKEFDEIAYSWTRTFAEVLQKTEQKHYRIKNLEECMQQAFSSFLSCLDPHSDFLGPKAFESISDKISGEFFGIGVVIDATRDSQDKFLTIIDTVPEGPSDKAGIRPMDKIIEISEKSIEGMTTEQAMLLLKGPRESSVNIKVIREGQSDLLEFSIGRDTVKEQVLLAFYFEQLQVYYVALTMFTSNSAQQLEQLLSKAKDKKVRALILDLRNNSGGLLSAAIDIIGLFVPKNSLVVTQKDKNNKEMNVHYTTRNPLEITMPIFILVNNFTASASEILAGCLKQHAEHNETPSKKKNKQTSVFIVGSKTFGKGSVQEVIPVSNNSAVKITTSLYFLPDNISIQGIGITPDFIVDRTFPPTKQVSWFTKYYGREQSLKNYIKIDNDPISNSEQTPDTSKPKKEENQSWSDRAQKRLQEDNQLRQTLTLINIYDIAKKTCPNQITDRKKAIDFMHSIFISDEKIAMIEVKTTQP
jgi:carboxyl-terminal processing protease